MYKSVVDNVNYIVLGKKKKRKKKEI